MNVVSLELSNACIAMQAIQSIIIALRPSRPCRLALAGLHRREPPRPKFNTSMSRFQLTQLQRLRPSLNHKLRTVTQKLVTSENIPALCPLCNSIQYLKRRLMSPMPQFAGIPTQTNMKGNWVDKTSYRTQEEYKVLGSDNKACKSQLDRIVGLEKRLHEVEEDGLAKALSGELGCRGESSQSQRIETRQSHTLSWPGEENPAKLP